MYLAKDQDLAHIILKFRKRETMHQLIKDKKSFNQYKTEWTQPEFHLGWDKITRCLTHMLPSLSWTRVYTTACLYVKCLGVQ